MPPPQQRLGLDGRALADLPDNSNGVGLDGGLVHGGEQAFLDDDVAVDDDGAHVGAREDVDEQRGRGRPPWRRA